MLDILFTISLIFFAGFIIFGSIVENRYYKYLKENHRDIWLKLGEPEYFFNLSPKIKNMIERFEKNKEYLILNDKKINDFIQFKGTLNCVCGWLLFFYLLVIVLRSIGGDFSSPWSSK